MRANFKLGRDLGNTPVSRHHLGGGENAPTAVGGYNLWANRAEHELSRLDTTHHSGKLYPGDEL